MAYDQKAEIIFQVLNMFIHWLIPETLAFYHSLIKRDINNYGMAGSCKTALSSIQYSFCHQALPQYFTYYHYNIIFAIQTLRSMQLTALFLSVLNIDSATAEKETVQFKLHNTLYIRYPIYLYKTKANLGSH